jgi:hypothetical protein
MTATGWPNTRNEAQNDCARDGSRWAVQGSECPALERGARCGGGAHHVAPHGRVELLLEEARKENHRDLRDHAEESVEMVQVAWDADQHLCAATAAAAAVSCLF